MMPLAECPICKNHDTPEKNHAYHHHIFIEGADTQRLIAYQLGYRKVPSVKKLYAFIFDGRYRQPTMMEQALELHAMLMEEKDEN